LAYSPCCTWKHI